MVTNASRLWLVLSFLPALVLVHPPSARADRIDIDDPSELGSLVFRENFGTDVFNNSKIADVRYAAGIYSYIYAIQTSPHFPGSGDDNELLSFAVRGHSLEETWGAIRHTDPTWSDGFLNPQAVTVESITPVFDGFLVVPGPNRDGVWTVVYMQSPRPLSQHGILTYTARGCILDFPVFDECRLPENIVTDSFQQGGFAVPTPEPASFVLFGLGLAALAAKLQASRDRRIVRPR
jgi:hypothetical protein